PSLSVFRRPLSAPLFPYTTLFRSVFLFLFTRKKKKGLNVLGFSSGDFPLDPPYRWNAFSVADHVTKKPFGITCYTKIDLVPPPMIRSEEHTSELQSRFELVCRLLL